MDRSFSGEHGLRLMAAMQASAAIAAAPEPAP